MSQYLDSSVLVASLSPDDPDHAACDALLNQAENWTTPHALNETFATLTGGRLHLVAARKTFERSECTNRQLQ